MPRGPEGHELNQFALLHAAPNHPAVAPTFHPTAVEIGRRKPVRSGPRRLVSVQ